MKKWNTNTTNNFEYTFWMQFYMFWVEQCRSNSYRIIYLGRYIVIFFFYLCFDEFYICNLHINLNKKYTYIIYILYIYIYNEIKYELLKPENHGVEPDNRGNYYFRTIFIKYTLYSWRNKRKYKIKKIHTRALVKTNTYSLDYIKIK